MLAPVVIRIRGLVVPRPRTVALMRRWYSICLVQLTPTAALVLTSARFRTYFNLFSRLPEKKKTPAPGTRRTGAATSGHFPTLSRVC